MIVTLITSIVSIVCIVALGVTLFKMFKLGTPITTEDMEKSAEYKSLASHLGSAVIACITVDALINGADGFDVVVGVTWIITAILDYFTYRKMKVIKAYEKLSEQLLVNGLFDITVGAILIVTYYIQG